MTISQMLAWVIAVALVIGASIVIFSDDRDCVANGRVRVCIDNSSEGE